MTGPAENIETRSMAGIETHAGAGEHQEDQRDDAPDLAEAVAAVGELRRAVTESRTAIEGQVTAIGDRLATVERRLSRPGSGTSQERRDDGAEVERRAFAGFIRRGPESLADVERRALRVDTGTSGGYLVEGDFLRELLKRLETASRFRTLARVIPVGSDSVSLPRITGNVAADWLGEVEEAPSTQPTFGALVIPVHRLGAYTEASLAMLEDAALPIEEILRDEFATQLGKAETTAFLVGNGTGKPRGLLTYPAGTAVGQVEQVASGNATAVTPDSLRVALYKLDPAYRTSAVWLMNSATLSSIATMKDGTGQYLWRPGMADGQPDTILGRPVVEEPSMPNEAAGTLPIAVGDLRRAYYVAARRDVTILRDPFSKSRSGLVGYTAYARVGGGLADSSAVKLLRCAVS